MGGWLCRWLGEGCRGVGGCDGRRGDFSAYVISMPSFTPHVSNREFLLVRVLAWYVVL